MSVTFIFILPLIGCLLALSSSLNKKNKLVLPMDFTVGAINTDKTNRHESLNTSNKLGDDIALRFKNNAYITLRVHEKITKNICTMCSPVGGQKIFRG